MTRCKMCHGVTKPGEKPTVIIIQTRPATYAGFYNGDRTTHGREIVKEIRVHAECAKTEAASVS